MLTYQKSHFFNEMSPRVGPTVEFHCSCSTGSVTGARLCSYYRRIRMAGLNLKTSYWIMWLRPKESWLDALALSRPQIQLSIDIRRQARRTELSGHYGTIECGLSVVPPRI